MQVSYYKNDDFCFNEWDSKLYKRFSKQVLIVKHNSTIFEYKPSIFDYLIKQVIYCYQPVTLNHEMHHIYNEIKLLENTSI